MSLAEELLDRFEEAAIQYNRSLWDKAIAHTMPMRKERYDRLRRQIINHFGRI